LTEEFGLKMFGNKKLRKIFGPESDKVKEGSVKLYTESLHSSPNIVQVIKPKRMRWAGNVARTMKRRGAYGVLVGNLRKETTWKRYAQLDLGRA
jgi:hypothetical protein